jgi:hypothetical protein
MNMLIADGTWNEISCGLEEFRLVLEDCNKPSHFVVPSDGKQAQTGCRLVLDKLGRVPLRHQLLPDLVVMGIYSESNDDAIDPRLSALASGFGRTSLSSELSSSMAMSSVSVKIDHNR